MPASKFEFRKYLPRFPEFIVCPPDTKCVVTYWVRQPWRKKITQPLLEKLRLKMESWGREISKQVSSNSPCFKLIVSPFCFSAPFCGKDALLLFIFGWRWQRPVVVTLEGEKMVESAKLMILFLFAHLCGKTDVVQLQIYMWATFPPCFFGKRQFLVGGRKKWGKFSLHLFLPLSNLNAKPTHLKYPNNYRIAFLLCKTTVFTLHKLYFSIFLYHYQQCLDLYGEASFCQKCWTPTTVKINKESPLTVLPKKTEVLFLSKTVKSDYCQKATYSSYCQKDWSILCVKYNTSLCFVKNYIYLKMKIMHLWKIWGVSKSWDLLLFNSITV